MCGVIRPSSLNCLTDSNCIKLPVRKIYLLSFFLYGWNVIIFVYEKFISRWCLFIQFVILLNKLVRFLFIVKLLWQDVSKYTSSANKTHGSLIIFRRSLMYIRNNKYPMTLPCGMDELTNLHLDRIFCICLICSLKYSISTYCSLCFKYDVDHLCAVPRIPTLYNFCSNIRCWTLP